MAGFFTQKTLMTASPDACGHCKLGKKCQSPKMKGFGKGKKKIMIVVDSPTKHDDENGALLSGDSGNLLVEMLADVGINMHDDCRVVPAIGCYTSEKINSQVCLPALMKEVHAFEPKIIVVLGNHALQSFYGNEFDSRDMESNQQLDGIERTRGFVIPNLEHKCWIVPTWAPRMVLGISQANGAAKVLWKKDLKQILEYIDKPLPEFPPMRDCIRLLDRDEAVTFLKRIIKRKPLIAFDYEATGLKLHAEGHSVRCVAVAVDANTVRCFELGEDVELIGLWQDVLMDKDIHKVGHNAFKYEDSANRVVLQVKRTRGWLGDTCLLAHCISGRPCFTSLKFQIRLNFGVGDWGKELNKYLESPDAGTGNNSFNKVYDAPWLKLGWYCASDALWTLRLWLLWVEQGWLSKVQMKPN